MAFARIVIRAPNWLGDIVMAVPAIAAARHAYAGSTLALALPAPFAALGASMRGVDEVVPLEGRGVGRVRRHAATLTAGRFDLGVLLTNSFASALALRLAGVPERWGVARDLRAPLLTRAVRPAAPAAGAGPREVPAGHHADYYLRILRALEVEPVDGPFVLDVPGPSRAQALQQLEAAGWVRDTPLVALAPGAAYGRAKRWPPERAADALLALSSQGIQGVLVGTSAD